MQLRVIVFLFDNYNIPLLSRQRQEIFVMRLIFLYIVVFFISQQQIYDFQWRWFFLRENDDNDNVVFIYDYTILYSRSVNLSVPVPVPVRLYYSVQRQLLLRELYYQSGIDDNNDDDYAKTASAVVGVGIGIGKSTDHEQRLWYMMDVTFPFRILFIEIKKQLIVQTRSTTTTLGKGWYTLKGIR